MKLMKNKKGFTLVELLAVIVVLAIVMAIAGLAITNVLDNTRKSAFVSTATVYISGARSIISTAEMDVILGNNTSGLAQYVPICGGTSGTKVKKIPLSVIKVDQPNPESPYGNKYLLCKECDGTEAHPFNESYSKVEAVGDDTSNQTSCDYRYSIFLTDGVYAIEGDDPKTPVLETALSTDEVTLALTEEN